jgi:hypothetical protein
MVFGFQKNSLERPWFQQQSTAPRPIFFYMDSICPCACAMMKIKNAKSPMKNNKTAKARLRGTRPVCFDGQLIGYTGKTFRELGAVAKKAIHPPGGLAAP